MVDYSFFEVTDLFERGREHIKHVEELTDAYHFTFGEPGCDGRLPARGPRRN